MKKSIAFVFVGIVVLSGIMFFFYFQFQKKIISSSEKISDEKLQVVASFYPLYFFASEIGGDKAEVLNLVPAGAEPHEYEPTPQDMIALEKSALIVMNGGGLEAWGADIEKNIDPQKTIILKAGENLMDIQSDKEGLRVDPHVWLSPSVAKEMTDNILQGFLRADGENEKYYTANAQKLKMKLETLDEEFETGLSDCAQKNIITSHSAFGYLARQYGFFQVSIAGLSPEVEPSLQDLADIVKFAKENEVKYIFFESLVSPKLSRTIADEVGAKTLVLDPLEGLSEGEASRGENYLTVMRKNLNNLKTALECQ